MKEIIDPPRGQRKVRMFTLSVIAIVLVVYGWLFSTREGDATAIILTTISLLAGGNAWFNQTNASIHKAEISEEPQKPTKEI